MALLQPQNLALMILGVLSALLLAASLGLLRGLVPSYLRFLWTFFLVLNVAEWISFTAAAWILAFFSFVALREYFSLVDIRLQDRWGILGAYLSIPFMTYMIQIYWYGMFIISIPVYAFLIVPLLIAMGGGDAKGTVFSIGLIDFGLFMFVFCIGHIAYLTRFSTWMGAFLIVSVALCDMVGRARSAKLNGQLSGTLLRYLLTAPLTVAVAIGMSGWMTLPLVHCVILGLLIPVLVLAGGFALRAIETDLGITEDRLLPGTGEVIHGVKSFLFAAPIVFHYIRYFWEEPVFG